VPRTSIILLLLLQVIIVIDCAAVNIITRTT